MNKNDLFKRASALGFPLLNLEESENANLTLAEMAQSRDLRLWEGFPVVLANAAEKGLFNYDEVDRFLKKGAHKACLASLVIMSLALYKYFNLNFFWADKLYKSFSAEKKRKVSLFLNKLKTEKKLHVAKTSMEPQRLKAVFGNYFNSAQNKLRELLSVREEMNLEYSLAQVFSPKQKELFLKKLRREKLTKTEKEYFSRVVKKKVLALADSQLHRLSQELLK